jgi:hypothetical protein
MTDITLSILALKPDAEVVVRGDSADNITWMDGNPTNITKEAILAKQVELQAEYDSQEYARKRKPEYPPIGDQLDALFHAGVFPADMAAQLQAVKDKYPKV